MAASDEIRKIVYVGAKLGAFAGDVLEDGEISLSDMRFFIDLLEPMSTLGEIDFGKAKEEFKLLDEVKVKELAYYFQDEFDIPQNIVECWIEETLNAVVDLYYALKNAVDVQKRHFPDF